MIASGTKRCPACGYGCPVKALKCRGCDRWFHEIGVQLRIPSTPIVPRRRFGCVQIALAVLLVLIVLTLLGGRPERFPSGDTERDQLTLIVVAEVNVQMHLLSPSSAHFSSPLTDPSYHIEYLGNNMWLVTGYVEAKNAFGVSLRSPFAATLKQTGPNRHDFVAVDVQVGQ
jgi:hypothetical protein